MIYDAYLGAVGSIFLLNAVQWSFFRDWIWGLFTFQTLLWFLYTLMQGIALTEPQGVALHTATNGLILISYLELVHRLFGGVRTQRRMGGWFRPAQMGIAGMLLAEAALMLMGPVHWQHTAIHTSLSLFYWAILAFCCIAGIRIAAERRDAVGRFFLVGSVFLLLNEGQTVVYFAGLLLNTSTFQTSPDRDLSGQIIVGGFIIELLSFSLCLVFRQRQLAVAQAVAQTQVTEQLVQQQLETELAVRRLEQEKTAVQLRALQAQVNPHFLFNSLNSLSSLIDDDPDRAGQFVDELSIVYRYLLKSNDQPLTTLASELDFIQSYYHLLKTRYGSGLDLVIRVNTDYQNHLLPPLTLQLLVENAVKHNVVSPKRPLTVEILTDEQSDLTVRNNLQRKTSRVLSNGVGLSTIAMQYQKLSQRSPIVADDNGEYAITLPLIAPSSDLASVS